MLQRCESCGNKYDKTFKVLINNEEHIFDSFECAINKLAPNCAHCHAKIIGHGVEVSDIFYCCNHCATQKVQIT